MKNDKKPATPRPPMSTTMFGNFEAAKNRKMPSWAIPLISGIIVV